MIERIAELLRKASSSNTVFPPTDLYNEGWMLRLVIDWFDRNRAVAHELQFAGGAQWYSEALLPSAFLASHRGDKLAESWTHADGVIGHFQIGRDGAGDLSLSTDANQLVVTEAKMFSKLSSGVTNARYFDQAARNVACIAEVVKRANRKPSSLERIAFYVIAPKSRIDEGLFDDQMKPEGIKRTVKRRVSEYEDDSKREWFENWFLPVLDMANIRSIAWEELLVDIESVNTSDARELRTFYEKCLEFNDFVRRRY